jgi:hypothetical protein
MEEGTEKFTKEWKARYKGLVIECFGSANDELLDKGYELIEELFKEFKTFNDDYTIFDEKYINKFEMLLNLSNEKIKWFIDHFTFDLINKGTLGEF